MRCQVNGLGQWVVTLDLDEMQRVHAALEYYGNEYENERTVSCAPGLGV